jgi:hypothetical protein
MTIGKWVTCCDKFDVGIAVRNIIVLGVSFVSESRRKSITFKNESSAFTI